MYLFQEMLTFLFENHDILFALHDCILKFPKKNCCDKMKNAIDPPLQFQIRNVVIEFKNVVIAFLRESFFLDEKFLKIFNVALMGFYRVGVQCFQYIELISHVERYE